MPVRLATGGVLRVAAVTFCWLALVCAGSGTGCKVVSVTANVFVGSAVRVSVGAVISTATGGSCTVRGGAVGALGSAA
ncbi:MAG: hypothetical protein ACR2I0_04720 [Rhodoferax sp.]